MRFAVPEGTTKISVQQQEYPVEHGTVDVPDHFEPYMLAHGFKRTKEGPIEINTTRLAKPTDIRT